MLQATADASLVHPAHERERRTMKTLPSRLLGPLMGILAVSFFGCATHTVRVVSEPEGADVTLDGVPHGETPCVVEVSEKSSSVWADLAGWARPTLVVSKPGYTSATRVVSPETDGLTRNETWPAMIAVKLSPLDGAPPTAASLPQARGEETPRASYCGRCGTRLEPGTRFCGACGARQ